MNEELRTRVERSLSREVCGEVRAYATMLGEEAGAAAVLFYGSNLRTGSLEGVLDFYVLLEGAQREKVWPRVSYREWTLDGVTLRAKIATMSLQRFHTAASGRSRDTTIWTRFVQPSALVYARRAKARTQVIDAIVEAAQTAGRLAAALGPAEGEAADYWRALFSATYRAELRVETPGREESILSVNREHFKGLLPLSWASQGLEFGRSGDWLSPALSDAERRRIRKWWRKRARLGKPLNILRLAKATATFDGAADYAAWKLRRHTGVALEVTPFRARHPLLSAPGAMLELWRKRRAQR